MTIDSTKINGYAPITGSNGINSTKVSGYSAIVGTGGINASKVNIYVVVLDKIIEIDPVLGALEGMSKDSIDRSSLISGQDLASSEEMGMDIAILENINNDSIVFSENIDSAPCLKDAFLVFVETLLPTSLVEEL